MPPSAIIDTDIAELNNALYYAIEEASIWKTDNLTTAGAATWTEVWTDADFQGDTFGGLLRVRVAPATAGLVYVIGWGKETGSDAKPFVLRSSNSGLTWSQTWIDEVLTEKPYTVTHRQGAWTDPGGVSIPHTRIATGTTYEVWAMAWKTETTDVTNPQYGLTGSANTIHNFSTSAEVESTVYGHENDLMDSTDQTTARGWLDDYFGVGSWSLTAGINRDMPNGAARVNVRLDSAWGATNPVWQADTWVFWNYPSVIGAKAFDVSRGNSNLLYLGLEDKIIKSDDGGFTWSDWYTTEGANDICIDPQIGGAVYTWDTLGQLILIFGGVFNSLFDTETPLEVPLRIARAINSGKLWMATGGTTIKMRNLGVLTTQSTGHSSATGLHAYLGDKLIFVDGTDIWTSEDGGTTWSAKKGAWGYAGGVNAHRMV